MGLVGFMLAILATNKQKVNRIFSGTFLSGKHPPEY